MAATHPLPSDAHRCGASAPDGSHRVLLGRHTRHPIPGAQKGRAPAHAVCDVGVPSTQRYDVCPSHRSPEPAQVGPASMGSGISSVFGCPESEHAAVVESSESNHARIQGFIRDGPPRIIARRCTDREAERSTRTDGAQRAARTAARAVANALSNASRSRYCEDRSRTPEEGFWSLRMRATIEITFDGSAVATR